MAERPPHIVRKAILWSIKLRCPRCGQGPTLKGFFAHRTQCPACGLIYVPDPVDHGMFMYFSTAAVTGLFLMGFFLIGFPVGGWARGLVGVSGLGIMVVTSPIRRSLGIGLIYLAEVFFAPDEDAP